MLEILALDDTGMTVRALKTGKQGRVAWKDLTTPGGRLHLAYGDTLTRSRHHPRVSLRVP